jgi:protein-tyrosine-phosphatase
MEDLPDLHNPESGSSLHSVLVLCTHNAVRSPICAAFLQEAFGNRLYVTSAGIEKDQDTVSRFAVETMKELGYDIGEHTPREYDDIEEECFDLVIALSSPAYEIARKIASGCPARIEYWDLQEPPGLMAGLSQTQMLEAHRRLRDDIRGHIEDRFGCKIKRKSGLHSA